ncbi:MAG: NAD(P)/FAD-dependent oxidoreductase [Myxococcales bacterium]|nr:NAD(P)/FAD-dependent oxidoreductase [Myxococcales bacterium]HIK84236.1 NAD(P)/FAD-dependent oxidoreductase [Myxococcales bacterium]
MEHLDVVIVGAGLSGIGAAVHLGERCPTKRYAILEARPTLGGTWDLFRYPGIRSDSDMHTLGYSFKPWRAKKAIADGPAILDYMNETASENDVRRHIRFRQALKSASWSSEQARWTLEIERTDTSDRVQLTCNFLSMCSGYFNYAEPHDPQFEGISKFRGEVVHPQFWPENLDFKGRRVVVIGSGATAMTLVPAMAEDAAHVTMLQRSPSYVVSRPAEDGIANTLRKFLPEKLAYRLTRFKNVQLQRFMYRRTRVAPEMVKERLLGMVREELGPDFDVDKHFTPRYNPWDQRLCLVPDGDLFEAIRSGRASVVTDEIDSLTESGISLKGGEEVEADIIVTATGLKLQLLSDVEFLVDGNKVNFPETYTYKGLMFSGVPNLVQTFGYINASWTLRADITSEFVCRVLNRMDELGTLICVPQLREEDKSMPELPWIDDFTPGYMQRQMHLFPKQSDRAPWRNTQNYLLDKKMIRRAPIEDGVLQFQAQDS